MGTAAVLASRAFRHSAVVRRSAAAAVHIVDKGVHGWIEKGCLLISIDVVEVG